MVKTAINAVPNGGTVDSAGQGMNGVKLPKAAGVPPPSVEARIVQKVRGLRITANH